MSVYMRIAVACLLRKKRAGSSATKVEVAGSSLAAAQGHTGEGWADVAQKGLSLRIHRFSLA